ncbi:hypothetical protein GCM10023185_29600 [Hymenobacter saemangeumensis]|uniref:Uncharacterized protein n=1 Tax=Hymenobacter saemangeumensis TaxID=1084522 RepID=A0ABP8ILM6_9BACT
MVFEQPVPSAVVTQISPVGAPAGASTVRLVLVLLVMGAVTATPPKVTLVAPPRLLPVMVTLVPAGPAVGVKLLTTGTVLITKLPALLAVPWGVVRLMGPVLAPAGTVAVRLVLVTLENTAARPLNCTLLVPVRLVPVMVTLVPATPEAGVKLLMVGACAAFTGVNTGVLAVPSVTPFRAAPVVAARLATVRPAPWPVRFMS